jgi:hypothetical protein
MGLPIRRTMRAKDVGELHRPGSPRARRRAGRGRRGHRGGYTPGGSGRSRGETVPSTRPWLRWK